MPENFARRLAERSETEGPISVARFMGLANAHYYATRDPFGAAGDFVTAPEISQMFGEIIGAALADVWARAGGGPVAYAELGPGRGTLARDAPSVMARAGLRPEVHLVETSPVLRSAQAKTVPGATFHNSIQTLPNGPLLIVANEFFDALPVRQLMRTGAGWQELFVEPDDQGRWVPHPAGRDRTALLPPTMRDASPGTLFETSPAARWTMRGLARRLGRQGGAMLLIDYGGNRPAHGGTLQAVRGHRAVCPFAAPGEHDLSAHVDFAELRSIAQRQGTCVAGAIGQGAWLSSLGLRQRAAALALHHPHRAEELTRAVQRLAEPDAMGELFKVLAVSGGGWPEVAGFT